MCSSFFLLLSRLLRKTNTMNTLIKTLFALTMMLPLAGLGQCETCEPDLSCVAVDFSIVSRTIAQRNSRRAVLGICDLQLASFRGRSRIGLVATLTVTISSVTGLPFGLEFSQATQMEFTSRATENTMVVLSLQGFRLSAAFFVNINVTVLCLRLGSSKLSKKASACRWLLNPEKAAMGPLHSA